MNPRRHPRMHAQRSQPTSNNTQSLHHNCVDSEQKHEPLLPPRSLKRKKSSSSVIVPDPSSSAPQSRNSETQRAENKAPAASKTTQAVSSASRQSSTRAFTAMGTPPLEPDLLVRIPLKKDKGITEESSKQPRDTRGRHNDVDQIDRQHTNIPAEKYMFTGPLAVAEYERMKKEIESLKEALHESRKTSRRQAKVLISNENIYVKANTLYDIAT